MIALDAEGKCAVLSALAVRPLASGALPAHPPRSILNSPFSMPQRHWEIGSLWTSLPRGERHQREVGGTSEQPPEIVSHPVREQSVASSVGM